MGWINDALQPGRGAGNRARWAALTPAERATEQAYADRNAAEFDRKVQSSQRVGRWVGRGVQGVVAAGAGMGALGAIGAGGAAAGGGGAPAFGLGAANTGAWASGVGAAPALAGGGAAGAAGAAKGVSMASRMPWLQVGGKAVDTLMGIYGNRQVSKANRDALAYQQSADNRAMTIEQAEREQLQRNFDAQQAELKRQWDSNQKFEADKFAASEEERLYRRGIDDKRQRLDDEREGRRAPYRQASADALARLPGLLASGRTSPGMGSLGSFRSGR